MACFLSSVIILFLVFMFLRFRLVEHFEAALSFEGDTSSSITCASYVENKKEMALYLLILGFQGEDSYMRCYNSFYQNKRPFLYVFFKGSQNE